MAARKSGKTAALLREIHDRLYQLYGDCRCPLIHRNPYELLVAVVLSAQCRDERVNQTTPALFARYPTVQALAAAEQTELEQLIHQVGLFRSKAGNLIAAARMLVRDYGGEVPPSLEEMVKLPGVGRKTANVMLGNAFDQPGFPVDTHVRRLLNRLGAVRSDSPEEIEAVVNANIAPEYWTNFSHLLIWHGRRVCHAGKPVCADCPLSGFCAFAVSKSSATGVKKHGRSEK